jgi:hypothetical protein
MKADWCERQRATRDVLIIGEMDDPHPRAGLLETELAITSNILGNIERGLVQICERPIYRWRGCLILTGGER